MISRGSEWRKWNLHMHSEYSREGHADIFLDRYAYTPSII